eukprot:2707862-Prymnesium_polylepis.1
MCIRDSLCQVGGFNKHQAVKVLERQTWVWARIEEYTEDGSSTYGTFSVELIDGQKRCGKTPESCV